MLPGVPEPHVGWRIAGSYFESCNCEAICPCRKIDGVPGGRSTYDECLGAFPDETPIVEIFPIFPTV